MRLRPTKRSANCGRRVISRPASSKKAKARGHAIGKRAQGAAKEAAVAACGRAARTSSFSSARTVKPKMLMIFTRQLATLIDAGLAPAARPQRSRKTGARHGPEERRSTSWPTPCKAAALSPKGWRSIRESSTISTSTWSRPASSAACSKSCSPVWPSSRKRRRRSKTRSSPPWSIRSSCSSWPSRSWFPARLHRAEVRSDFPRHAWRQAAAGDHALRHRRQRLRAEPLD